MIFVDTSVVLAQLLAEDRRPPASLWSETLVASRLLEYEVWNRLHARGLARTHGDSARALLDRLAFLELERPVLARALEPFPTQPRTLDAMHLASAAFLRERVSDLAFASYDERQVAVARAMSWTLYPI